MTRRLPEPVGHVTRRGSTVQAVRMAGEDHAVVTVVGGQQAGYMKKPCGGCPWRTDTVGLFPAEAFRHSAPTAYDMAQSTFACHESGVEMGKTCAGFLLRGADHNLAVRMKLMTGAIGDDVRSNVELHDNYRAMAVANGVDPHDPILSPCR